MRSRTGTGRAAERTRRLDSDAAAVQIMTVWVSKGLQYPVVYLPFGFNRHIFDDELLLFHEDGVRSLDIGGKSRSGLHEPTRRRWRAEVAGDDIRLTYVALTRAQSQVVAWWAPSWDEVNGGISRLLRGRKQDDAVVPDSLDKAPSDDEVLTWLRRWQQAGGPVVEESVIAEQLEPVPEELPVRARGRSFTREVDVAWRRTSYSGLIRAADQQPGGVTSEPEDAELEDESVEPVPTRRASCRPTRCRPRWTGCRSAPPSVRWCTRCSRTPTRTLPTCPPSWLDRAREQLRLLARRRDPRRAGRGDAAAARHAARARSCRD